MHSLPGGGQVFAGQRAEGFYVDLGAIFDLGDLRPFQQLHDHFGLNAGSKRRRESTRPRRQRALDRAPGADQLPRPAAAAPARPPASSVIGVWTTASRQQGPGLDPARGTGVESGPWVQVSRLGNPLVNEVLIPMARRTTGTRSARRRQAVRGGRAPTRSWHSCCRPLPGGVPEPGGLNTAAASADLVAILLTGHPVRSRPGFQNSTGKTQADMLRLNMAIPPTHRARATSA